MLKQGQVWMLGKKNMAGEVKGSANALF
jgi:hypothetical protein